MQMIYLVPTTSTGDVLAHIPLLDFAVTEAGAGDEIAVPTMLRCQLELLQELIGFALGQEGLEAIEDEFGLRLSIAEALADASEAAPVELRVAVKGLAHGAKTRPEEGFPSSFWAAFFSEQGS